MDIYVNEEKTELDTEGAKTIGDVLKAFEIECEKQDGAVVRIEIDDEVITAETFDATSLKDVKDDTKFKFEVVTKQGVNEELKNFKDVLLKTAGELKEVGTQLQMGHEKQVNELFQRLTVEMDNLCYCIKLSAFFGDYGSKIMVGTVSFDKFFDELAVYLGELADALEAKDSVAIGDLSEYEIAVRIESLANSLEAVDDI